ncbi:MAG TPA: glycosyltransferase family 4 protein [Victivallales bacterium]|nr:glycosyltransferase family 4 protein [Victivallales bacterium]
MKKMPKLKICHIITRMIIGGAQENTLLSVVGLIEKGHDVTLVTGPTSGPEGKLLYENYLVQKYNIKIVEIRSLARNINPLKDLKAYFNIKKYLKKNQFDVVHTHSSKAGIIGRYAAYTVKVPYIVHTIHGQAFHRNETKIKNFLYQRLEKWSAGKCNKIYAVAQAMIDQCIEKNIAKPDKYKLIYSGMDLGPFLKHSENTVLKQKLKIPENSPVIGTVARLFPLKGYDYLIDVVSKIVKQIPELRVVIVGDGILKDELEKQISDLGVSENFIFAGLINPNEIPEYINVMDVLLHLSLREGLPRAVVQALASGKPAIGFNLDGTPEVIVNNKTGYIAESGDIDKVYEYTIKLLKNPELAKELGRNGREFVKSKFDWHYMCDQLEDDYDKGQ